MTNDREALLQFSQAFCEELSNDDEGLKREILAHAGNRWSLGYCISWAPTGRCATAR